MKRAAIIIGNQGSGKNFLPGVSQDISNYRSFILSDEGGAWESHEIYDSMNWTKQSLNIRIESLKRQRVDYFFIVFTGHGFADSEGNIYMELGNDENLALEDLQRWVLFKKSLIIVDCCRVMVQLIEKAHEQNHISFTGRLTTIPRHKYRELFDLEINKLNSCHNTVVTAANHNECAEDSDRGGLFSSSLLDYANSIKSHGMSCVYNIQMIYNHIASIVSTNAIGSQHPQLYSNSKDKNPPFVVIPSRW